MSLPLHLEHVWGKAFDLNDPPQIRQHGLSVIIPIHLHDRQIWLDHLPGILR
jgi:hypothetical protein